MKICRKKNNLEKKGGGCVKKPLSLVSKKVWADTMKEEQIWDASSVSRYSRN